MPGRSARKCRLVRGWSKSFRPGGDAVSDMKTPSLAAFASQLRAWRQQMGWTQVEAADKLGYSASLVSGIETMDKTPTADFAARCDTIFGTPRSEEHTS